MARAPRSKGPVVSEKTDTSLGRVGIIALVGFVIGVFWPRLAGVSLVPEAPVDHSPFVPDEAEEVEAKAAEPELIELAPEDRLGISPAKITSCVDAEGKKASNCDSVDVDSIVHPALISLLGCPAATGVFGTLSLGLKIDFEKGKVFDATSGRSTDLPKATADELLLCAEKEFHLIQVKPLKKQYVEYQVYYQLEFKTPEAAAEAKTSVTPASGQATVQWRVAQIRAEGERDAEVVSRLLSGARVVVTGRNGEWYRVKYDAKGREGWVHGAALGLK